MKKFGFHNLLQYACSLLLMGFSNMAHSVEEPSYRLLDQIGHIEIRHYDSVVQASTTLADSGKTSDGFRRLAGFIFGNNAAEQKISMTAPVQETLGGATTEMAFTMPAAYSMESLPIPNDSRVTLSEIPPRTVAVISFSGWATRGKVDRYQTQLAEMLQSMQIDAIGVPVLNQYNPPWTLPFLRRNEIMLEIDKKESNQVSSYSSPLYDAKTYSF